jgi:hypothetical protein
MHETGLETYQMINGLYLHYAILAECYATLRVFTEKNPKKIPHKKIQNKIQFLPASSKSSKGLLFTLLFLFLFLLLLFLLG